MASNSHENDDLILNETKEDEKIEPSEEIEDQIEKENAIKDDGEKDENQNDNEPNDENKLLEQSIEPETTSPLKTDDLVEDDSIVLASPPPPVLTPDVDLPSNTPHDNKKTFKLLYFSHGLSSWGDRMWAFTMGMLLVDWENLQTLRTVAIHQLCQALAVFVFGALIGAWVDKAKRLKATITSIIIQNVFVTASAFAMLLLMKLTQDRDPTAPSEWQHHFAIGIAIAFSTLAYLASVACQLTVVKDWVPTLCREDRIKLTQTNATLKRIDLSTAILSPLLAGAAMEFISPWTGGLVVMLWNVVSSPLEIYLLYRVYKMNPMLSKPKKPTRPLSQVRSGAYLRTVLPGDQTWYSRAPFLRPIVLLFQGWFCYWRQKVRWSGASLALIYFTGLSQYN